MNKLLLALFLALGPSAFASIWFVDGVNGDDNNNCKTRQTACKTIGHAISLASTGDTIGVGPATYTENLTIEFSLNVIGSGAETTIVKGGAAGTVVTISSLAIDVVLSKLTISGGARGVGTAGKNVSINESTISGNHGAPTRFCVTAGGAGIHNYSGGTLTINRSTVSDNTIGGSNQGLACGGGIFNSGTLVINNSTVSGNVAKQNNGQGIGGGIDNYSGSLVIRGGTVSGNSASDGGGIAGAASITNSIVANNSTGNCNATLRSDGYNLSSDGTCSLNGPGDLNNTDPKLGSLQNNGGPTQTEALLEGSPAIDAGNPNGCTDGQGHLLKTDQRGAPRPDKEDSGGCDMGAFERQSD